MCGFIAQLVAHRTGIRGGHGFESRWSPNIFQASFFPIASIGKFTAMITLHFHLQPQYKYELFHIYFTWFYCTGWYELNKLTLLPNVWLHSSVGRASHRYSGRSWVRIPLKPWFFWLLLSNCLNWKIYCDDHTSLSLSLSLSKIVSQAQGLRQRLSFDHSQCAAVSFQF